MNWITNVCLVALLFLFSGCTEETEGREKLEKGQAPQVKVDFHVAQSEVLPQLVSSPGTVRPFEHIDIYSEVNGILRKINFEEGILVSKGTVLVAIDSDLLLAEKQQIKVDLEFAQKDEERKKQLYESKAGTFEQWELASARTNSLEAQLKLIDTRIDKTLIRAPFSGKLGMRSISEGAYVTTATKISSLAQIDRLKIDFSIPQKFAGKVKVGQQFTIKIAGNSDTLTGEVYAIDPIIDAESRMLNIRGVCSGNGALFPGSFVQVTINLGNNPDGIMIPTSALVPVLNGQQIWKIENRQANPTLVEIGQRTANKIEILEGVQAGDTIITSGLLGMRKGMSVKVKK